MKEIKALVACEESQKVCFELQDMGVEAFSCDMKEPSGNDWTCHILGDCTPLLNGNCTFKTMDGMSHTIEGKWDLIIAHPPCTFLTNAGACRMFRKQYDGEYQMVNINRLKEGILARELFMRCLNADCDHIAVENPIPMSIWQLPKYDQVIQPYEYGHPYSKKTCLWLKGLPKLQPTEIVTPTISWVSGGSKKADGTPRENKGEKFRDSKTKSTTFLGVAQAMATQWISYLRNQ